MLFNSINYIIFLPIVIIIYFILPYKFRNIFLLIASYYFYACWIPKYLILIIITTILTYLTSIFIDKSKKDKSKKIFLALGIIINLLILFFFKYFDFFFNNIKILINFVAPTIKLTNSLKVLLPVGISFYTFQSIGYCIDVYRKDTKCEYNFITYALFVSFFPQLVAGPIERSGNLIKQFYDKHNFSYENAVCGSRYILSGMFRKVAIADLCAIIVNGVYNNLTNYSGIILIVATLLFAIQIYCDFSGYSMIAIGSAKILGFDLMENFKSPYFSKNISEFWSRWHISLSTWFKDYIYIPLGGNRKGWYRKLINLTIVFLVSGLWHGAAWTFVLWGGLHSLFRIIEEILKRFKKSKKVNKVKDILKVLLTFSLVCFAWIFFRANNIHDAIYVISHINGNYNLFGDTGLINLIGIIISKIMDVKLFRFMFIALLGFNILLLILEDYKMYKNNYNISTYYDKCKKFRYILYFVQSIIIILFFIILNISYTQTSQFIYFQF